MTPLISVIIPARNNATTIKTALESIVDQTYSHIEILVVNDNSQDETVDVVKHMQQGDSRIQLLSVPFDDPHRFNHRGVNTNAGWMARNFGIDHAHGAWVTFQDADDASMRNRLETQLNLAQQYGSNHVCINWQRFDEKLIDTTLDIEPYLKQPHAIIKAPALTDLARNTKGPGCALPIHSLVPFPLKRRLRFFFPSWDPYPFAGNCPLVKREVFERVRFRPSHTRVWPSDRGRGADRDFNFQVAYTFHNSLCTNIPLYLWRVERQNPFLPTL